MKKSIREFDAMSNMYGIPKVLYTMRRGIKHKGPLRYDIIEIPSQTINGHLNKTQGHVHPHKYMELYAVEEGDAIFFFQKGVNPVRDCYAVKAKKGEFVICLKGYYHITINPGPRVLKASNWSQTECPWKYKTFKKMNGACYYFYKDSVGLNPKYKKVPKLKWKKPITKPVDIDFLL
jgi:oxalate decarboxylase/phosphoglucose isomerase-like protein (cupin superfamily)